MNDVGLVSVIVPIYGVEKYLSECVDSILSQSYSRLEVILVDDESPDTCPTICEEYAKKDARVRVFHKKNGGAGSAKNLGLEYATGDYICLVDSDDVLKPTFIQELLTRLIRENADVAVCSFSNWYADAIEPNVVEYPQEQVFSRAEYLTRFLTDWTSGIAWNKLFKKHTLQNVRYVEGHKIDDEFFTYKGILNSEKIVMFNMPLYAYRMRQSSVMQSGVHYQERMYLDRIEYFQQRYQDIVKAEPSLKDVFYTNMVDSFTRFWKESYGMEQVQSLLKQWKKSHFWKIVFCNMPFKSKLLCIRALYFKEPKESIANVEQAYNHIYFI